MAKRQQGRVSRRRAVGAEVDGRETSFRVWAPERERVWVVLDRGGEHALAREEGGYFAGTLEGVGVGERYRFRLDDDHRLYPDPASRFQPEGPHGSSQIVDPSTFRWGDAGWLGVSIAGRVVYEMHIGTFTQAGTWAAAAERLPFLAEIGINVVEMMPVADFSGRFGWGYDGVDLFAPTRLYGDPDDLRRFVDAAHAAGIGVILDVVYNHLGPDGNFLACFSPHYFTDKYQTEWGEALNFDGPNSREVRRFFTDNAAYWIDEFHFDGLRLDATQSIFDGTIPHVVAEIGEAARAAAHSRTIILIGENEPQDTGLVRPVGEGGCGLDALWNDDLHHSATVALTGRSEAYYEDHTGTPQEFISAAKHGYLFQGQVYAHQRKRRGRPGLDLPPPAFVTFVQNHDQVANSDSGLRFHALTNPALARAMTAYMLLSPGTPMLFQGQEFWSSSPFFYFCDHNLELSKLVRDGRVEFMTQFASVADDAALRASLADPSSEETFRRSKLDWSDAARSEEIVSLHRDLLRLREKAVEGGLQDTRALDGAVIGPNAFALRTLTRRAGSERLFLFNFGRDLSRRSIPEPLLAPPDGMSWRLAWSSEDVRYGGHGTPQVEHTSGWHLPAHSALMMIADNAI